MNEYLVNYRVDGQVSVMADSHSEALEKAVEKARDNMEFNSNIDVEIIHVFECLAIFHEIVLDKKER